MINIKTGDRVYLKERPSKYYGIRSCGTIVDVAPFTYTIQFDDQESTVYCAKVDVLRVGELEDFSNCKFYPGDTVEIDIDKPIKIEVGYLKTVTLRKGMVGLVIDRNEKPLVRFQEDLGVDLDTNIFGDSRHILDVDQHLLKKIETGVFYRKVRID